MLFLIRMTMLDTLDTSSVFEVLVRLLTYSCFLSNLLQDEDDDDLDLFGDETEEEKAAAAKREADKKKSDKPKVGKCNYPLTADYCDELGIFSSKSL